MSIRELVTGIRRHLVLLATALLLGAGIASLVTVLLPKSYESKATIFVLVSPAQSQSGQSGDQGGDQSGDGALNVQYQGALFAQERVRSYTDLATVPRVTAPVIGELHLHMRPDTLAKRLSVEVPINTVLMNVSVRDSDPQRAALIVNSVTRHLIEAISELETTKPGLPPAVRLQVVRPGTAPSAPSSPKPVLNIAIGLILGAIAGVAAGALTDALDTRIGHAADLAKVSDLPVLGEVPYDAAARKRVLVDDSDPFGARAEAFRKLRTNLRFIGVDRPPRTIVVSSPLEGDGKSSATLNLAFSLADDGARVILVDADLRRPSIARSLGLVEGAGLTSVLSGQATISDVTQRAKRRSVIDVITSGPVPPNPSELLGARKMHLVLQELAANADYVIVDSPPLLPVTDAAVVASGADGIVLVVRAGRTKRDELRTTLDQLTTVGADTLGVVVNMAKTGNRSRYYRYHGGTGTPADGTPPARPPAQGAGTRRPAPLAANSTNSTNSTNSANSASGASAEEPVW